MLTRAARRTSTRFDANITFDAQSGVLLPFLCPALIRRRPAASTASGRERRQRPAVASTPIQTDRPHTRHLASAATAIDTPASTFADSPSNQSQAHWDWQYPLASRAGSTASSGPIVLNHDILPSSQRGSRRNGISNDSTELLQTIYTCLRVHRWDRAEACISRLAEQSRASASEIAHAHQAYFEARANNITSGEEALAEYQAMLRWWRAQIRPQSNLLMDDMLKIALVKAALLVDSSEKWRSELRRLLKELAIPQERLLTDPSFTDDDFRQLCTVIAGRHTKAYDNLLEQYAATPVEEDQDIDSGPELDIAFGQTSVPYKDLPEVLRVEQKSLNLPALKEGLEAISDTTRLLYSDLGHDSDRDLEREILLENSASTAAVARWKAENDHLQALGINLVIRSKPIGALMWTWYSALLPAIEAEIAQLKKALDAAPATKNDDRISHGIYLESLSAEELAANTILHLLNMLGRGKEHDINAYTSDMKLVTVAAGLGKAIQNESNAKAAPKLTADAKKMPGRHRGGSFQRAANPSAIDWPADIRVRIGALLLSKLIETATLRVTRKLPRTEQEVTQLQPAFSHKTIYRVGRKQGYLQPSPDLLELFHKEPVGELVCKKLPMIAQPMPWTDYKFGGYYKYHTEFIRFPATDATPRAYAAAAIARGDMNTVFAAVNSLGKVPWLINSSILQVQIEAWNKRETIADFAFPGNAIYPTEPVESGDPNVRKRWLMQVKEIKEKHANLHSLRCHQNLQLETARAFRNETIYLPHNIDFRGRAYPIPPYLSHMGADNTRALLVFAKGKPLGVSGLRWLKIHLANVAGNDKASLQEREDWVMEHIDKVYDSAERPLTGDRWWAKSDDAWQTLAACFELRNALESPDPTQFVSHLPIHQDGTCNGLQHYAALGGDEIGARQVNLEPGERPSDIYSAVAQGVEAQVAKALEAGDPRAKILHGHVGRRVVKQPVMTNVYGVTGFGVRAQVKKQLEEIFPEIQKTDKHNHGRLAAYIGEKITISLNEMFNGAQALQEWFGKCADRITSSVNVDQIDDIRAGQKQPEKSQKSNKKDPKSMAAARRHFKTSVIWTTPLRLPVVQPYRSASRIQVTTAIQTVTLQQPQTWDPIDKRRQLQGFPPNFIHSLDASHMMLSAIKCDERGITFASIHDSFWTHASSIDDMSEVLRNAFITMHSEDIVGRLREEFMTRYKDNMYLATVDADSPVGKRIKKQQTAMSKQRRAWATQTAGSTLMSDLLIETDRIKLLKSNDPAERAKGEKMITPGSVYEQDPDEASLILPAEINSSLLGGVDAVGADVADADLDAKQDIQADDTALSEEGQAGIDAGIEDNEAVKAMIQSQVARATKGSRASRTAMLEAEEDYEVDGGGQAKNATPKLSASRNKKVYVWLPMSFPDVPKKGTFDVRRLKESRYFFH